jgi:hypothetical protein
LPAETNAGTKRLIDELIRKEPPPPPVADAPRLTADPPGPGTGVFPGAWVTSLIRQLGGVGGTVPGLAGSRHTTTGDFTRKFVAGIVLCCASFPGQVPPPTGVQVNALPLN